ncbi:MAG TPA: multiheme c-type cytochrome, partial [Candidatus Binatia bacterium]|nr:multiheme c-type cytochrome [Candidatus Binatia bacterium]
MAQKKSHKPKAPPVKPKKQRGRGLVWGGLATAMIIGATAIFYFLVYRSPHPNPPPEEEGKNNSSLSARYVGSKACVACHEQQASEWQKSQHHDAMAPANEQSVLGNFNNAKFVYGGLTSTFFKRDGKFFANTEGHDGKLTDYEIKYTFGLFPLQQYLVEFSDGRVQALLTAWDARAKQDGGQRWFHLYPNERVSHDDELHWTRPAQNWNFMCADCHSTGLRKNYDPVANRFQTQWAEINVACEACHGPGSQHLEWATAKIPLNPPLPKREAVNSSGKGLGARLDERRDVVWTPNPTTGNSVRSKPRASDHEIEVCAQCHARRGQIAEGYQAGKPFLDFYRPALLTGPLYHSDGQQRGEVYNWGSFLQSKMYASGVTCSDCHNPHSGKLRERGNTLCATCHLPSKYDTTAHHHHKPASAGAACVACHMPAATYMVVDSRRDHSLRVPRPDLSVKFATPNPCNGCHSNRDPRWAAAQVEAWYGHEPQGFQRFAGAFAAASTGAPDAAAQLRAIAADASHPAIVRASALMQMNVALSKSALDAAADGSRDRNPLVRLAALQSLANAPLASRVSLAAPLLSDPLKALRIEAASLLASVPGDQLSVEQRAAFERAGAEYIASQRYNADRTEARVNLGTFYANRGETAKAEQEI